MAKKDDRISKATELRELFIAAVDHDTWSQYNRNATTDFEYREGIQWTTDDKKEVERRGQAATVENEISPIVDRVNGQYISQKTKMIYKGRNLGKDETTSNTLSDLALHVQQQSGYEFEEAEMFDDGQVSGFGCLEISIDYDDDLTPRIDLSAENSLNIYPDPDSKKYDWNRDAEYICRAKWVPVEKAVKLHPGFKAEIRAYVNQNPVDNTSQTMERNYLVKYINEEAERVRLVEVWYKEYQPRTKIVTDSDVIDITDKKKKEVAKIKQDNPGYVVHDRLDIEMRVGLLVGDVLIYNKESPYEHNLFPFVPFFVKRRKNGEPYSMVRLLKDPQMEINKRRSKALHLLNTNQAVYEENAVRDEDNLKKQMAKPDGLIKFRKGYSFEMVKNIDLAAGQMEFQMESKNAITRISGIGDSSLNRASEVRSGIGLQRKQMQTDIIITHIFNNLRRTRLMVAKLIHELIRQYYTEEKTFSVLDNMEKTREFDVTKTDLENIKEGIYDYIIEEAPNVATLQEEQFAYLAELVKGLGLPPNVSVALLPMLMRLSAFREKEQIATLMEQLQQIPPEQPKMSLNLVWSELYPEERAHFANVMGNQQLAEFELQVQHDPQHVVKAKTDLAKEASKNNGDQSV